MYRAEHRSGKGGNVTEEWSDRSTCSVMAKMKLVSIWVKREKQTWNQKMRKLKKEERRRIEILRERSSV